MKKILLLAAAAATFAAAHAQLSPVGTLQLDAELGPFIVTAAAAQPIYTAPEGEKTMYTRKSNGFWPRFTATNSYYFDYPDAGCAVEKIVSPSGQIFLSSPMPPMPSFNCKCYITADEDEDGNLVIQFPQPIYENEGKVLCAMVMKAVNAETYEYMPADAEAQKYVLKKEGKGYVSANKDAVISLVYLEDVTNIKKVDWYGYSVFDISMEEFNREPVTPPADASEAKAWSFISEYKGHEIKAVTKGNDIWFQGIAEAYPEGWAKATINGDLVNFETAQYLGISSSEQHYVFLNTTNYKKVANDQGTYTTTYSFTGFANFEYDKETERMTASEDKGFYLASTTGGNTTYTFDIYRSPRLQPQNREETTPPAAPVFWRVAVYTPSNGAGSIRVWLPNYDVKGNIINSNYLYWNLIVDGEVYEFNPDTYNYMTQAMTDIPFNYEVAGDIIRRSDTAMGDYTLIFYKFEGWDTLGMRTVYINGDTRVDSETITCTPETLPSIRPGVESVYGDGKVVSTEYYDFTGMRVLNPEKGMYVLVEKMNNGRVRTSKVVVK